MDSLSTDCGLVIVEGAVVMLCNNDVTFNNFRDHPLFQSVQKQIRELPPEIIKFLKRYWFSLDGNDEEFWIYQVLKHATQGEDIMVENFWTKIIELAEPILVNEGGSYNLIDETKNDNPKELQFHSCEGFSQRVSRAYGKEVKVTFVRDEEQLPMPNELVFLFQENGSKFDHLETHIDHFYRFRF